jgi:hypothetical protein
VGRPGRETPTLSLHGLLDTLTALREQLQEESSLIPTWSRELEISLTKRLGYTDTS